MGGRPSCCRGSEEGKEEGPADVTGVPDEHTPLILTGSGRGSTATASVHVELSDHSSALDHEPSPEPAPEPSPEPSPEPDEIARSESPAQVDGGYVNLTLRFSNRHRSIESETQEVHVNKESSSAFILRTSKYLFGASGFNDKDFEMFLERTDTVLSPANTLESYDIADKDVIELRRKQLPIAVEIQFHDKHSQTFTVNAAALVVDVVQSICSTLGIDNDEELSLANCNMVQGSLQVLWLDTTQSLQFQEIKDGDTLLLRKKFFVLNLDVREAIKKKGLLLDLLYYQVKGCYLQGHGYSNSDKLPAVSAYLHHVEQGDADIEDREAVQRVVPEGLWSNTEFFVHVAEAYQSASVGSMEREEAMGKVVYLLAKHSVTTGYFEITFPTDSQNGWIVITPQVVALCTDGGGHLKPFLNWPLNKVRQFKGTGDAFKFRASDDWQKVLTPHAPLIANYLQDILALIHRKAEQGAVMSQQTFYIPPDNESSLPIDLYQLEEAEDEEEEEDEDSADEDSSDEENTCCPEPPRPDGTIPEPVTEKAIQASYSAAIEHGVEFKSVGPSLPPPKVRAQPSFFPLEFQQILRVYRLFHIVILDKDVRALLVNLEHTVGQVICKVCSTFDISNPETFCLWMSYGVKFNMKSGKHFFKGSVAREMEPKLERDLPLREQFLDLDVRPLILHLRKMDATDKPVSAEDVGTEWPTFEHPGVRVRREFHQCWCGVVQGDYPVPRETAIRVAGLLTQVFFSDCDDEDSWPPEGLIVKQFLPPMHKKGRGVERDVEKMHRSCYGMTLDEAREAIVQACKESLTYEGLFFPVIHFTNEKKGLVVKTKVKKKKIFGINHQGVFDVNRKTGELNFTHRFTDIRSWAPQNPALTDQLFQLDFHYWDQRYVAVTPRTPEIIAVLQIFIDKIRKGYIRVEPKLPEWMDTSAPRGTDT